VPSTSVLGEARNVFRLSRIKGPLVFSLKDITSKNKRKCKTEGNRHRWKTRKERKNEAGRVGIEDAWVIRQRDCSQSFHLYKTTWESETLVQVPALELQVLLKQYSEALSSNSSTTKHQLLPFNYGIFDELVNFSELLLLTYSVIKIPRMWHVQ
jgi:hypothetical protein